MNEKLEKIISFAISDGIVTDKEKEILFRKAVEEGADLDEFELILDAKLYEKQQEQKEKIGAQITSPQTQIAGKTNSNKEGDLKKCPSCGAPTQSFKTNCPECGHEFRNVPVNKTIKELLEELKKNENSSFINNSEYQIARAEIIRSFSMPTTKEDLIEFTTKGIAEISDKHHYLQEDCMAWKSKVDEGISKLKIISLNDYSILPLLENIENMLSNKMSRVEANKKTENRIMLISLLIIGIAVLWVAVIKPILKKNNILD
jgi:hypothetical protein